MTKYLIKQVARRSYLNASKTLHPSISLSTAEPVEGCWGEFRGTRTTLSSVSRYYGGRERTPRYACLSGSLAGWRLRLRRQMLRAGVGPPSRHPLRTAPHHQHGPLFVTHPPCTVIRRQVPRSHNTTRVLEAIRDTPPFGSVLCIEVINGWGEEGRTHRNVCQILICGLGFLEVIRRSISLK